MSDSKATQLQDSYRKLSKEAHHLNTASDEFTSAVGVLDEAIKRLNVGLTVWVSYSSWDDGPEYENQQIGYAKINGTWGIALRAQHGDISRDIEEVTGPWLFGDAPREMRLDAVGKLPALVAKLSDEAAATAEKVKAKAQEARDLAAAIGLPITEPGQPKRGGR